MEEEEDSFTINEDEIQLFEEGDDDQTENDETIYCDCEYV